MGSSVFSVVVIVFSCEYSVQTSSQNHFYILQALVTIHHKDKQLHVIKMYFTKKSISRLLCIFSPVNCKQKLTGEVMKS